MADFDVEGFLETLFGTGTGSAEDLEDVLVALSRLPISDELKKYGLVLYLDRVGLRLRRWMVDALRGVWTSRE